jgi:hypothetical protein
VLLLGALHLTSCWVIDVLAIALSLANEVLGALKRTGGKKYLGVCYTRGTIFPLFLQILFNKEKRTIQAEDIARNKSGIAGVCDPT